MDLMAIMKEALVDLMAIMKAALVREKEFQLQNTTACKRKVSKGWKHYQTYAFELNEIVQKQIKSAG